MAERDRPLRIGNCSGFYGDRLSAMREMLEGDSDGHTLDVLTGDYLAELTMLILGRDQLEDPSLGYARTFARQVEDCLGLALERGVRIVSNAGGLNPTGLVARIGEIATAQGLSPKVALRPSLAETAARVIAPCTIAEMTSPIRTETRPAAIIAPGEIPAIA